MFFGTSPTEIIIFGSNVRLSACIHTPKLTVSYMNLSNKYTAIGIGTPYFLSFNFLVYEPKGVFLKNVPGRRPGDKRTI